MSKKQPKTKKAKELAREIYRCEMVLQSDDASQLEKQQAMAKVNLITRAYQNDFEMLIMLDEEIQKMLTK